MKTYETCSLFLLLIGRAFLDFPVLREGKVTSARMSSMSSKTLYQYIKTGLKPAITSLNFSAFPLGVHWEKRGSDVALTSQRACETEH